MMKRRIASICLALALCLSLLPGTALAAGETYLALGDSITTGYAPGNTTVGSPFADQVAAALGYTLDNQAAVGETSGTLNNKLTNLSSSISNASLITITIGGNDLMNALYNYLAEEWNAGHEGDSKTAQDIQTMLTSINTSDPASLMDLYTLVGYLGGFAESEQATEALGTFGTNLASIVTAIKAQNSNATILVATQYNPYYALAKSAEGTAFADTASQISNAFETGVAALNGAIKMVASAGSCQVVDVYTAFRSAVDGDPSVNPCNASMATLDFHPNQAGHDRIAQAVVQALAVPVAGAVASIGEKGYPTLEAALLAAGDGDTIVMRQSVELTQGVDVGREVTLDLNGCTITNAQSWTGSDYLVAVKRGGRLTINDSSSPSTGQIITQGSDVLCAVKMTVKGEAATGDLAGLTVNGGTISGYQYGIAGNGNRHDTYVKIYGGSIQSQATYDPDNNIDSIAIYQPQDGTLSIYGGTISSPNTAIEIRAGILEVYDGTIQGGSGAPAVNPNGNGGTTSNTGIAVAQHTTGQEIDVMVYSGTISGGAAVYESNPQNQDGSAPVTVWLQDAVLTGDLISSGFGDTTVTGVAVNGGVDFSGSGTLLVQGGTINGGVTNHAAGALTILDSTVTGQIQGSSAEATNIDNSTVNGQLINGQFPQGAIARVGAVYFTTLTGALTEAKSTGNSIYLFGEAALAESIEGTHLYVQPGARLTMDNLTFVTADGGDLNIEAGGSLVIAGKPFVGSGEDAQVRLTRGMVSINTNQYSKDTSIVFTYDAAAEIPAGQELVLPYDVSIYSSTLTVKGKLTVDNGRSLAFLTGSQLEVASGGILRVNAQGTVTSEAGTISNSGVIALMQEGEKQAAVTAPIALGSGGAVYSQFDAQGLTIQNAQAQALDPAQAVEGVASSTETGDLVPTFGYRYSYYVPSSSGGGGGSSSTTYPTAVESAANGAVEVSPKNASKNDTVTITLTPDEGYELASLTVTDASGNVLEVTSQGDGRYTFSMPASKVTVEAVFAQIPPEPPPFTDVGEDTWFAGAVRYVYEQGLMAGYGDSLFGPGDELSRAQLCQILYNLESQPAADGGSFMDVASGAWYADAVNWAAEQNIVGGYGNGQFGPEDNITREQLAAILYRYAQMKGYDVSVGEDTNILSYSDALGISEWATPAMQWACGAGILEGSAGRLNPQGDATRAEVAARRMRFCPQYSA